MSKTITEVRLSATPTAEEIAAWHNLPRNEQLRRLKQELSHPDACVAGPHTMADIWDKIKAQRLVG